MFGNTISRGYRVTHLTNIVDLDMIAGIQLRSDNGDLFQRLHEFVTEVCERLDSVTDRGDGGYAKYEKFDNTTSSVTIANYSPMKRVARSSYRGIVITGDRTIVISGSTLFT
jgi:hypothetical protein